MQAVLQGGKPPAAANLERAAPVTLRRWRSSDDLVDVDPKVNDELPDREKWIAFWADVDAAIRE